MKKLLFLLVVMCLAPSSLLADEVDNGLPSGVSATIKEGARMAIKQGAVSQGVIKMTRMMIENKYQEQQILEVYLILMNAKQQGVPDSPIVNKFYECTQKKQKAESTIMAMETVRSNYETADRYAGIMTRDKAQASLLSELIMQCINAGMGEADMKQITELLQKKTKDMKPEEAQSLNNKALNTVKAIARSGAAPISITDLVSNAFKRNYSEKDMETLCTAFLKQCKGKSNATILADSYSDAISAGAKADELAETESESR